jgi:flagellar biosynthetic protein FliQ
LETEAVLVDTLTLVLKLGAPALGACLVVSLLVGFAQSATHASDAALSFVPRWLAVLAALFLGRAFFASQLVGFTTEIFREMARL